MCSQAKTMHSDLVSCSGHTTHDSDNGSADGCDKDTSVVVLERMVLRMGEGWVWAWL